MLSRLSRLHEPSDSSTAAYSNRTPSPNRQSLYDWAPGSEDAAQDDIDLDFLLEELRRREVDRHADREVGLSQSRTAETRERAEGAERVSNEQLGIVERRTRFRERRTRENEWVSLRSRAMTQRARQEGSGSPSATERMLRYVMDRERSGISEEEERARGSGWFRPTATRGEDVEHASSNAASTNWLLPPSASDARDRDRQERVEAFRRGYLAENVPPRLPWNSSPAPMTSSAAADSTRTSLENALQYLSELRSCTRYEEALSTAIDHRLATKEYFADKHDDFVLDLDEIPSLPFSSWLQSSATFEGHQYATGGPMTLNQSRAPSISHVEQINPNYASTNNPSHGPSSFDHPPGSTRVTTFESLRPWPLGMLTASTLKETHDHWPVRVTMHAVDTNKMTLQGTMEAWNVPQQPSHLPSGAPNISPDRLGKLGKKSAPITTYLEGHIIDIHTHSFLTPKPTTETILFPSATPQTDAQNWHHLPPFSSLPAHEVAPLLLSRRRLRGVLGEYVFMRWKEKCFIHAAKGDPCTASLAERSGDQDRGHGLTISGFYYVSLRRRDGRLEGLYFDPKSAPEQILRLSGGTKGVGSWEFR